MKVFYKNKDILLPDFFVVGAPKCGTTSLYEFFLNSEEVFLPSPKEPQYFAYKNKPAVYKVYGKQKQYEGIINGLDEYVKIFEKAREGQLIGDFSTHYLRFSKEFVANVREVYGEKMNKLRIIIMLRDPVKRAFSHYTMRLRNGSEPLPFKEAIQQETIDRRIRQGYMPTYDYIRFSKYEEDVKQMQANFKDVGVFCFEDLIKNQKQTIERIADFIGIKDSSFIERAELAKSNASGVARPGALNKLLFDTIFKKNILKRLLPQSIKKKIASNIKNQVGSKVMQKQPMDVEDEKAAYELLKEEYHKSNAPYSQKSQLTSGNE